MDGTSRLDGHFSEVSELINGVLGQCFMIRSNTRIRKNSILTGSQPRMGGRSLGIRARSPLALGDGEQYQKRRTYALWLTPPQLVSWNALCQRFPIPCHYPYFGGVRDLPVCRERAGRCSVNDRLQNRTCVVGPRVFQLQSTTHS